MLLAALDDVGLADAPRGALMVGHDHRDRQMARAAGVRYIHADALRAGRLDQIVEPDAAEYGPRAPQTFNPKGKFEHGVNPDGRSGDYLAAGASSAQQGRWSAGA